MQVIDVLLLSSKFTLLACCVKSVMAFTYFSFLERHCHRLGLLSGVSVLTWQAPGAQRPGHPAVSSCSALESAAAPPPSPLDAVAVSAFDGTPPQEELSLAS